MLGLGGTSSFAVFVYLRICVFVFDFDGLGYWGVAPGEMEEVVGESKSGAVPLTQNSII